MDGLYGFFFLQHDPKIVLVAALVCLLSAYACIRLVRHAEKSGPARRMTWVAVSALAVGFGIWSTHFIGILAYHPGFPVGYSVGTTAVSLAIAVLVCGLGLFMAVVANTRRDIGLGGAIVGLGIASMHYTGMAALEYGGTIGWNPQLAALSVVFGMGFGAAALVVGRGGGPVRLTAGALLLTTAICAMHFSAMSAADFSTCFGVQTESASISPVLLSVGIGVATVMILLLVLGTLLLDNADRRRTREETARRLNDADKINEVSRRLTLALTHMGQGLGLFDREGKLVLSNDRLAELLGLPIGLDPIGYGLRELYVAAAEKSPLRLDDPERFALRVEEVYRQHTEAIRGPRGGEVMHTTPSGRVVRVHHSPIGDVSWVTTVDDVTERQRSQTQIEYMARHDGLTGLPNRGSYLELLDRALVDARRLGTQLAVVQIDLDSFKDVNDTYGHAVGDRLLQLLSSRLRETLKEGEVVARLGGDEFAAFAPAGSTDHLAGFLARLEHSLCATLDVDGVQLAASASFGVAVFPDHQEDRSKLLADADLAMYRAKASVDVRVCYFEPEMDEQARERRTMGRELWQAIDKAEFFLNYQVQKSVETGATTGFEVLLRWRHPVRGLVSPAEFIPVAEECGAISEIGKWVLRTACKEAMAAGLAHQIAVNISPLQLANANLAEMVRHVLFETGLPPRRLQLEVTETAIIADKVSALHNLRQVKAMGVGIALDDFGTGYSSLDTLRSFPFDKMKLDRSFITDLETNQQSKSIVRAILALGKNLGIPVIAEGVETKRQLDILRREGCAEAQGYFLGYPLPIASVTGTAVAPAAVA